jgi:hypothetical protein
MAEIAQQPRQIGICAKLEPIERAGFFAGYAAKKYRKGIIRQRAARRQCQTRLAAFVVKDGAFAYGNHPDIDALYPQQADEPTDKRASILGNTQARSRRRSTRRSTRLPERRWPRTA